MRCNQRFLKSEALQLSKSRINASKRGLAILQAQYLNENEYAGAWQMLYAAALTYVAGVCATLASMLRILFMILSSSNRDSN